MCNLKLSHPGQNCLFSRLLRLSGSSLLIRSVLIGGILQKWSSSWKALLSPQSNVGALLQWPSGSWSPPWLVRQRALGRVLLVYKRLPFRDEAAEFTGTSTPWYNPVTEISRQFTGLIVCRILRWKVNLIHFGVRLKWQKFLHSIYILLAGKLNAAIRFISAWNNNY